MRTSDLRLLCRSVLLVLMVCAALQADQAAPCNGSGWDEFTNVAVISNGFSSFCVDDFGYSNVWYPTSTPGSYTAGQNALGSSAQFLTYKLDGATKSSWLAYEVWTGGDWVQTGSPFSPVFGSEVHNLSASQAQSVISNGEVEITITSTYGAEGIGITYVVKNVYGEGFAISDLSMVQFFEYYPNGVTGDATGSLEYTPIRTTGGALVEGLISGRNANRSLAVGATCGGWGSGCATPDAHHIGATGATGTFAVVSAGMGAANNASSVLNPAAGALQYNLTGSLDFGQEATFTLELVPEPGMLSLLGLGAGFMAAAYRRRRRA